MTQKSELTGSPLPALREGEHSGGAAAYVKTKRLLTTRNSRTRLERVRNLVCQRRHWLFTYRKGRGAAQIQQVRVETLTRCRRGRARRATGRRCRAATRSASAGNPRPAANIEPRRRPISRPAGRR